MAASAHLMRMKMTRFVNPQPQFFTDLGLPLSEGNLYFYLTETNTPFNTYSDPDLTTANQNPVPLDAGGSPEFDIWLDGVYKVVLKDKDDNLIWEKDPVGGDAGSRLAFGLWTAGITYSIDNVVTGSDGNFYVSLINNNLNNDPTSSPSSWEKVAFIRFWNTNVTYALGDIVQSSAGLMYRSLQDSNTGNAVTDAAWWSPAVEVLLQSVQKTNGDTLEWGVQNSISATGTFTMPLANAVDAQVFMEIYFPSADASRVITINRAGSDSFLRGTATDTQYILNVSTAAGSRYITSNGSNRLVI